MEVSKIPAISAKKLLKKYSYCIVIESKQSGAFKRTNTDLMHLIEKCENGDRFAAFRMSRIACSMKTLFDFFFGMRRERSSG